MVKPILCAIPLVAALAGVPAVAQESGSGVVRLYGWAPAYDHVVSDTSDVLIDSLTLGFGYRLIDDKPYMAFALEWKPAGAFSSDSAAIASMELVADVTVEGEAVTRFYLEIDSLMLGAYPDLARLEYVDVEWEDLFEETDEETARSYFSKGFTLENLQIVRIQFEPELERPLLVAEEPQIRRGGSGRVVRTGGGVWVDIPIYREPRVRPRSGRGPDSAGQPRGENVGRGESRGRGEERESDDRTRSDTKKKDDDEEEDEDAELLPAALVGAAAIAAVAVAGGTVGYYGNMKHAPIGLMAGLVQGEGGVLLQVAVNEAVFQQSGGPERGLARVVSFYDLFKAPIQPALGLGVLVDEPAGDFEYEFSLSLGIVARAGPVLLLGGVDVMTGGADFGMAYNFKYKR